MQRWPLRSDTKYTRSSLPQTGPDTASPPRVNWTRPEPSALTIQMSSPLPLQGVLSGRGVVERFTVANTRLRPSLDQEWVIAAQEGEPMIYAGLEASTLGDPAAADKSTVQTAYQCSPCSRALWKASRRPSGDHSGYSPYTPR